MHHFARRLGIPALTRQSPCATLCLTLKFSFSYLWQDPETIHAYWCIAMSHRLLTNRVVPNPGRSNPPKFPVPADSVQDRGVERDRPFSASDAELVLSSLRRLVAARASETDVLWKAIAEAAQSLTLANGAAIAVERDGAVVCCARSGETAPNVGTRLSVDSGISGECLRTGKAMRCDDAYTDHRVDPVVCRVLGLRSVAIAPLLERNHAVGILEAFSTRPYAFNEQHMIYLQQLAEITAAARTPKRQSLSPPIGTSVMRVLPAGFSGSMDTGRTALKGWWEKLQPVGKHRATRLVLASLAIIALFTGWTLHKPKSLPVPSAPPAYSAVTPEDAVEVPIAASEMIAPKSKPKRVGEEPVSRVIERSSRRRSRQGKENQEDAPEVVIRVMNAPEARISPLSAPADKAKVPAAPEAVAEPKIVPAPSDNATLTSLIGGPLRKPAFNPPVSGGVSPGVLQHKVEPAYPRDARAMGLRGSVRLQITIAEDGTVRDPQVVNGNPILARAALAAVRQWRYRPTLLNGKPTQSQAQVVVDFQAP